MPTVTFIYGDQIKKVQGDTGESLLKIGLDADIPIENACGGNGFCTTCLCQVKEGMASLSDRTEREENMGVMNDPDRLTCQATVQGDVTVELSDF
jgi:ferredoxin